MLSCNSMVQIYLIQTRVRTVLNYILSAKGSVDQSTHVARKHTDPEPVLGWLCVEGMNMVLYRGPPSILVLDVGEEDEVSLPMRLQACALQVAASSIFSPGLANNLAGWPGKTIPDGVVTETM